MIENQIKIPLEVSSGEFRLWRKNASPVVLETSQYFLGTYIFQCITDNPVTWISDSTYWNMIQTIDCLSACYVVNRVVYGTLHVTVLVVSDSVCTASSEG